MDMVVRGTFLPGFLLSKGWAGDLIRNAPWLQIGVDRPCWGVAPRARAHTGRPYHSGKGVPERS